MLTIYVVSDGSGRTAEQLVRAAMMQFRDAPLTLVQRGQIRTAKRIRQVVEEAAKDDSIIVHTLVTDKLRSLMLTQCHLQGVDSFDMMGPVLDRLARHMQLSPQEKPGLMKQLTEARSREIEAVDFAFRHDDGQNAADLDRAEVVLVGVSRTKKTPTMLYLAYHGWFAANIPLVPGIPVPDELRAVSSKRVFCLLISPNRLFELRRARAVTGAIPLEPYASMEHIREELRHAQHVAVEHGWQRIETTGKSVEEVGREIIALLPDREKRLKSGRSGRR